jgi:hypothetical protein
MSGKTSMSLILKQAAEIVEYVEGRYNLVEFSLIRGDYIDSPDFGRYELILYVDGTPEEILDLWNSIYDNFTTEGFVLSVLPKEMVGENVNGGRN